MKKTQLIIPMDESLTHGLLPHEIEYPLLFAIIIVALIVLPQCLCPFNMKTKDD